MMVFDFGSTGRAMLDPLLNLWNGFVVVLPGVVAALVVIIIGYFIAALLGRATYKVLEKIGVDKQMKRAKLSDAMGHMELSHFTGAIIKWYIFIIFLGEAANLVQLGRLSILLNKFLLWLPNLIIALIIAAFGWIFADFIADRLEKVKIKSVRLISVVVRIVIVFFIAIIALQQIGVELTLAENTFLILIGAIALALSLAIGLSFGFAFRDEAKNWIKRVKKKI